MKTTIPTRADRRRGRTRRRGRPGRAGPGLPATPPDDARALRAGHPAGELRALLGPPRHAVRRPRRIPPGPIRPGQQARPAHCGRVRLGHRGPGRVPRRHRDPGQCPVIPPAPVHVSRWGELRGERKRRPGTVLRVLVGGQHAGTLARDGHGWQAVHQARALAFAVGSCASYASWRRMRSSPSSQPTSWFLGSSTGIGEPHCSCPSSHYLSTGGTCSPLPCSSCTWQSTSRAGGDACGDPRSDSPAAQWCTERSALPQRPNYNRVAPHRRPRTRSLAGIGNQQGGHHRCREHHPGIKPERHAGGQVNGQHLDQVKADPGETVMVLKVFFWEAQRPKDGPHNEPGGNNQVDPPPDAGLAAAPPVGCPGHRCWRRPAGLHVLDSFLQGLVDVLRAHVELFGGLLLRPGHGVLDRVFDLVLPNYDEPGLARVDEVAELFRV
jgi:hypothetical protein